MTGADAGICDDGRLRVEHQTYYVSRNPRRIVSSEDIWRHAWPHSVPFNAESLHVHIYRLRRRLAPHLVRIETMVNVGYGLMTENDEPGTPNAE